MATLNEILAPMNGTQLAAVYNHFLNDDKKRIERFASKEIGLQRTSTLLEMKQIPLAKLEAFMQVGSGVGKGVMNMKDAPAPKVEPEAPARTAKEAVQKAVNKAIAKGSPVIVEKPVKAAASAKKVAAPPAPAPAVAPKASELTEMQKRYLQLLRKKPMLLGDVSFEMDMTPTELAPLTAALQAGKFIEVDTKEDTVKLSAKGTTVVPAAAKRAAPRADGEEPRKQNTPPHLNLRCPKCGYYVKSTPAMLEIARVKCPVDGQKLLTKEERGEHRGR